MNSLFDQAFIERAIYPIVRNSLFNVQLETEFNEYYERLENVQEKRIKLKEKFKKENKVKITAKISVIPADKNLNLYFDGALSNPILDFMKNIFNPTFNQIKDLILPKPEKIRKTICCYGRLYCR